MAKQHKGQMQKPGSSDEKKDPVRKDYNDLLNFINNLGLKEQEKKTIEKEIQKIVFSQSYSSFRGPVPPPAVLAEYNNAVPNGAERILTMAENQSKHRQEIEKEVISNRIKIEARGQLYAFIIAIVFGVIAGALVYNGNEISGSVFGALTLGSLVTAFIKGKQTQRKELAEKDIKS
jgi:uncharacterized membrane protein